MVSCSAVDELLPSFIGCLESHDHSVVSAAITSIPDLILLCKGSSYMYVLSYYITTAYNTQSPPLQLKMPSSCSISSSLLPLTPLITVAQNSLEL